MSNYNWIQKAGRIGLAFVLLVVVLAGITTFIYWELIFGVKLKPTRESISLNSLFPYHKPLPNRNDRGLTYADSISSTAVIVIQDGQLIAEWGATDHKINTHSVRKSLMSALYGIAFDKGLIDTSNTIGLLGYDDENPPLEAEEKNARIVDLLTARSGIYHNSVKADFERDRPARGSHPPGTHFYYNNWSFNALGTIFEQETNLTMGKAFKEWIAEPTGMQDFQVEDVTYTYNDESIYPAYRFWMSARDLARFGVLFLQEGKWENDQIISSSWIKESTKAYSDVGYYGYGFMWWTIDDGSYFATGTGGQKLLIDPNRNLVAVNRVNTSKGLGRVIWFFLGRRVNNPQFFELVDRIIEETDH